MIKNIHYLEELTVDSKNFLSQNLKTIANINFGEKIKSDSSPDILISGLPPEDIFDNYPSIKTLIIPWSGLPRVTRTLVMNCRKINVFNIHYNADIVAEHTMALLFSTAREICPINSNFKKHNWSDRYKEPTLILLKKKTVTILGYGTIGKKVGIICNSLGMKVIAVKKNISNKTDNIYSLNNLIELLPKSDVLIISLPFTNETKELLKAKELSLLPDNAIVINIGRGMIINEEALFNELKSKRIKAGLDVWYNYPKSEAEYSDCHPSKYKFHELDNVVMTPHLAGNALESEKLRNDALIELIKNIVNNKSPKPVDVLAGY